MSFEESLKRNWHWWLVALFLIALVIRLTIVLVVYDLLTAPIQRYDSYIYTLKALEITKGDWSPIRTHSVGWPAFLAAFFYFWQSSSIFENFLYAIIITTIVSSALIFPLAYLSGRLLYLKRNILLVLLSFIFTYSLIIPEGTLIILSEPLFSFLFLLALCFIFKARDQSGFIFLAAAISALAYFVRPTGLFLLPILLISYWLLTKHWLRLRILYSVFIIIIFFVVALPFLYQRHLYFGSAFDYGGNSEYFIENYTSAWGDVFPKTSFFNYLNQHSLTDWFKKFVVAGFFLALTYFFYSILPLIFFFIIGWSTSKDNRLWLITKIIFVVWFIGLIPVFSIYYLPRHFFPVLPLALIMAVAGFRQLVGNRENHYRLDSAFIIYQIIILFLSTSILIWAMKTLAKDISLNRRDALVWAQWAAVNVKGKVAVGDGSDILMMNLSDARIGGRGMMDMIAPQSGLSTIYPGKVEQLDDLREWFREKEVTHLLLDDERWSPVFFLPSKHLKIYTGEDIPDYFKEIYSNYQTNSQWKVRLFKIDWEKYE